MRGTKCENRGVATKKKRTVGCKWVFDVKYIFDGSVEKYKTRSVAKSNTQTHGVGYYDTFAPMAKMNTMWILMSLAANFN